MCKDVFVVAEQRDGVIQRVSFELIGAAARLAADLGEEVSAVLVGCDITARADTLCQYGASRVLVVDHPVLETYTTAPYVKAVAHVIKTSEPRIVLFGAGGISSDMAPRIAARLHTGLTADCTRLDVDMETYKAYLRASSSLPAERIDSLDPADRSLKMTHPVLGGSVMTTTVCRSRPQMATIRPGVMAMPRRDARRRGEIVPVDAGLSMDDMDVEILDELPCGQRAAEISAAKILVSGGRGVGSVEGYAPLRELARELGGELASSRIGADDGWVERDRQVGQTGKTVHPELYLACGISGAAQHLAGMERSDCVISINTDAACPMMRLADLGIVGDLHSIVSRLTAAIRAYRAGQGV